MSNILVYDGALTDKNYAAMAAGSDPEPVEEPVATGDVTSHPAHTAHTTTAHYIGLPYQDHNYGAPPPPTPPQSPSPVPIVSPVLTKVNGIFDEPLKLDVKVTVSPSELPESKDEGVTRCICNFEHDDGYMICCDRCYVWQHVDCMGLERNNIPETFYCERCQPREVDRHRAIALQSKKRAAMSDDSSSDSGDEVPTVSMGSSATYTAISNSPTSLTLTTHNKHKKMKKKKKKRCKEKEDDKHHKKKKKRHSKRCNKSEEVTAPMELDIMDEEALPAWNDSEETHDRYEEAICNQYSADIQHVISSHSKGQKPDPSPFLSGLHRPAYPLVNLNTFGKSASCAGIVASENLRSNDFIVEYWGKVMLKEQLEGEKPFFKRHYPYVLFYSKFNNVDICVDARNYGNVARFVRRSCSPNAEVRHYVENNVLHFCLFALLNIAKKTEVTIGFDFNYADSSSPVQCACSKKNCIVRRHFRKQNHQVTKAKNHIGNHLQDSSSLSVSSNLSKKRTVSPLRVSLSAHNAQNHAQPQPTSDGNESSHRTPNNSEPSPSHPANNSIPAQVGNEGSEENQAEVKPAPTSARKMTREERKMEAILQAFARMEKTEKRRKEALERTSGSKTAAPAVNTANAAETNTATKAPPRQQEEKPEEKEETAVTEEVTVEKEETPPSAPVEEVASVEVIALDSSATTPVSTSVTSIPATAVATSTSTTRTKTFKGRKRKGARRRSRMNSGASAVSVDFSSHDEESNQSQGPQSVNLPVASSSSQAPLLIQTTFSPSQGAEQQGMASPVPTCSKHFKFPKTKKFFMNEWLNEKAQEASVNKPLTIKTEPADILTASSSSPGASLQLAKSGPLWSLNGKEVKGNLEASFGSAKKRWLRQAMSESTGPVPKAQSSGSNNSGSESPVCNGTLSPNPASYPVSPALSPNVNNSGTDLMTPLKKRMLRHSIAEDRVTTTPPPASAQLEDKLRSQSTPSTPVVADDVQAQPAVDGTDSSGKLEGDVGSTSGVAGLSTPGQVEPVVSPSECPLDTRRRSLPFPFPLPARKDFRKSSSVDSGLSVTTPADLDRSPLSLLPGDQLQQSASQAKDEGTPVKDELYMHTDLRSHGMIPEEGTYEKSSNSELDSQRRIESSVLVGVSQERREDSDNLTRRGSTDAKTEQSAVLLSTEKSTPNRFQVGDSRVASSGSEIATANKDAPLNLDYSLSASQGSLSASLQSSQSSLSDLHKSYMSLPELGRSRTSLPDMSRSASSAELQLSSVVRKLDMKPDLYSTQRISEEPGTHNQRQVTGDVTSQRIRHLSGCSVSSGSSADQTNGQLPLRQSFAEDQVQGNMYSSFGSPMKRPSLGQSPEGGGLNQMQPATSGYNPSQSSAAQPVNPDSSGVPLDHLERKEAPQTYLQPLDGPHAADSESPATEAHMRGPSWSQIPNAGPPTGPGRPVGPPPPPGGMEGRTAENIDSGAPGVGYRPIPVGANEGHAGMHGEPGQMGPGRPLIPGQAPPFGVPPSPVKGPLGPGLARPAGSPLVPGTPPSGIVSPVAGTPPAAKKRVSLLEYRKRKGNDLGNNKTTKTSTSASAPTTPVAPKPSLTTLKPPLPSPVSSSNPSTPTKPLESPLKASSSNTSTPTAQLPSLPLFTTDKENGVGERLSLSTEAQQVISSLTSLLKKHKKSDEDATQEPRWSSSRPDNPDEDPLQKMRKELKEKNRERERKEALSHKRPRSPDPPPPPPSKKPNPGLRLQIPPPPPPKTKTDTRPGDVSGESTPVKMPNPAGNTTPVRTPGSAGIYPQQLGKSFTGQASSPYLPAPVKAPFQQPYQAQQYSQQQPQQQQQQQPQHQAGYNPSYPVYDYNHQKSHGAQQQFTQYHQGQQAPLVQQGQYQQQQHPKQGYQNPYPQAQQQGYNPAAVAAQPQLQQQQQQQYPKVGSKFGSNPNMGTKGGFGVDGRTSKPPFPANANSYSPRRGTYYQN